MDVEEGNGSVRIYQFQEQSGAEGQWHLLGRLSGDALKDYMAFNRVRGPPFHSCDNMLTYKSER